MGIRVFVVVIFAAGLSVQAVSGQSVPAIDGFNDDVFWATGARVWTVPDADRLENQDRFWIGHDNQFLYFAADVADQEVVGAHRGRKDQVWLDDAVEVFLDFGDGAAAERTPQTFEYGFSPAGGVNWTRGTGDGSGKTYPAHDWPPPWDSQVQWACRLKAGTTLNVVGDRDTGYVVEARIPWSELGQTPPFAADRTIGINFLNIRRPEQKGDQPHFLTTTAGVDFTNNHCPRLWQRIRLDWLGPLEFRGLVEDLPLWLGSGAHNQHWRRYQQAETDPAGEWLDRRRWAADLEEMQAQHFNALLLLHPHPFSGLLDLADFPAAAYFKDGERQKHREHFQWLLTEAKQRNMKVYLSCWNIRLPPRRAESPKLDEFGTDTPQARAYLRKAVAELFDTYPDLAGLAVMAGEQPPGCVDFVIESVVGGLQDSRAAKTATQPADIPELIYWAWGSYPEDAARVIEAYPHVRLMHDLQGRQWFKPMIDPRLPLFDRKVRQLLAPKNVSPAPTIAFGGPQSALKYLFWADPRWLRQVSLELRRQDTGGLFFYSEAADSGLAREAAGRYLFEAGQDFDQREWEGKLNNLYGVGKYAGQLLETMEHASGIVPRLLCLLHEQSDRFMPQFGLPLVYYPALPTLSTYVSEHEQVLDSRGYLTPQLGPTWPNPDWGERLAAVAEEVSDTVPAGATRPQTVADQIREHCEAGRARLSNLRNYPVPNPDQKEALAALLDRLEFNIALGEHFYNRINAALAWENFKAKRVHPHACIKALQDSLEAWDRAVTLAERLYPEPVPYWRSQMVSVPPWTAEQLWQSYQPVEGHWREQSRLFAREFDVLRENINRYDTRATLPLWDLITSLPEGQVKLVHLISFEKDPDRRLRLSQAASITREPGKVIEGKGSLLIDTRQLGEDWHVVMNTDPRYAALPPYRPCQISLVYRVLEAGQHRESPFALVVAPAGTTEFAGGQGVWSAPAGHEGARVIQVPAPPSDHRLFFAVHGQVVVILDEIRIATPVNP